MGLELSKKEITHYANEIRDEFEALMGSPMFASRPSSRQWEFFRFLFELTLGGHKGIFTGNEKQIVNYKFEINARLRDYYLSFGRPVDFVFRLVSVKRSGPASPIQRGYPSSHGYALQIFFNKQDPDSLQLNKLTVEKTIGKALSLELAAYEGLAESDIDNLKAVFDPNSSAFKKIARIVRTHRDKRHWNISNPGNPSTNRLIDVRIKEITAKTAVVRTTEYWLLLWWDEKAAKYAHYYNETNWQTYFLEKRKRRWVVVDNPYSQPSTSAPRRNLRRFQRQQTKGLQS